MKVGANFSTRLKEKAVRIKQPPKTQSGNCQEMFDTYSDKCEDQAKVVSKGQLDCFLLDTAGGQSSLSYKPGDSQSSSGKQLGGGENNEEV